MVIFLSWRHISTQKEQQKNSLCNERLPSRLLTFVKSSFLFFCFPFFFFSWLKKKKFCRPSCALSERTLFYQHPSVFILSVSCNPNGRMEKKKAFFSSAQRGTKCFVNEKKTSCFGLVQCSSFISRFTLCFPLST